MVPSSVFKLKILLRPRKQHSGIATQPNNVLSHDAEMIIDAQEKQVSSTIKEKGASPALK